MKTKSKNEMGVSLASTLESPDANKRSYYGYYFCFAVGFILGHWVF